MELRRGEIYYLTFPYTLDPKYPNGKPKFVLILSQNNLFRINYISPQRINQAYFHNMQNK